MDCVLSIPNNIINKFKCSLCNNYLSHFPVSLIEDGGNVCGRCTVPEETNRFHCKIFEEFARHIKFPCRYKEQGCCEELYPEDVPSHEKSCYYKIVECPGKDFINCAWNGIGGIMFSHCRKTHDDMFLNDKMFKLNLNVASLSRNFLEHDGALLRIGLKYDPRNKILKYGIYHVEEATPSKNYWYKIILRRDKGKIIFKNETTSFSERKWCEIALESLITDNNEQTSPIEGNITFEKNVKRPGKELDDNILSLLKCSECDYYVLPPVYRSLSNNKMKCDNCRLEKNGSRNLELNQIAEKINYPCQYATNGCDVVLKYKEMKEHLSDCVFKGRHCLFCNEWSGARKLFKSHVLEKHGNLIIANGAEILLKNTDEKLLRIIHYDNQLFLLNCFVKYVNLPLFLFPVIVWKGPLRYYMCKVNIVDNVENNFIYEVEMKNVKGVVKDCVLMQRSCSPLSENKDQNAEEMCCKLIEKNNILWQETDEIPLKVRIFKQ